MSRIDQLDDVGDLDNPVEYAPDRAIDSLDRGDAEVQSLSIVVIGAGGHGRELADIVKAIEATTADLSLLGVVDDGDPDRALLARSGIRFLGSSDAVADRDVAIAIGIGDPATRERIDSRAPERAVPPLIHPSAQLGSACRLEPGVVLAQNALLTTNVRLGRHTHINVAASVSHDCRLGDYVTVSPGARLAGAVEVGDRAFIGIGATILPGVKIGADVMIGAGAVVCEDVSDGRTVRGVPAR